MEVLLHLVSLGALFRSQRRVELAERFGPNHGHLAQQLPLLRGKLLHLSIVVACFGRRHECLAIRFQLIAKRLGCLASLLEDGLGLRLLGVGQVQRLRQARAMLTNEVMTARRRVGRRCRGRRLREYQTGGERRECC